MALTDKQQAFINEYLKCWNATQAAKKAGYSEKTAYSIGQENLKKPEIASHIRERIQANAMTADEVLSRLGAQARGDFGDLVDTATMTLDWHRAQENDATRLIKKLKQTIITSGEDRQTEIFEFEMYDAQAALVHIGKQLGLFTNKLEHTGKEGGPIKTESKVTLLSELSDEELDRIIDGKPPTS